MKVNGQLCVSAAWPLQKEPPLPPSTAGWVGARASQSQPGCCGEQKNFLLWSGIKT